MAKKVIKTGYGLGLLSIHQGKKAAAQVKRDLHLSDEESMHLAKEFVASSSKASKEVLKVAEKNIMAAVLRTKLVRKRDLMKMRKAVRKKMQHFSRKK
ncbi:MAG: hypothetical protein Q8R37_04065 [Nanoarchaeota archaeon]|nr:hypothetical protein [Nanoarchaeota archaeon]